MNYQDHTIRVFPTKSGRRWTLTCTCNQKFLRTRTTEDIAYEDGAKHLIFVAMYDQKISKPAPSPRAKLSVIHR